MPAWVVTLLLVLGGVAAVLTITSFVTQWGRRVRRRLVARIRRRPSVPRTLVVIEPYSGVTGCNWGESPAPPGRPGKHFYFQMRCMATNVTPLVDLEVVGVELQGVKGSRVHEMVNSWDKRGRGGWITDPKLPTGEAVGLMLIVAVERDALSAGPHKARMVIRDHLGQRHRSPKVTFEDANRWASEPVPSSDGGTVDQGAG